jgi:O-antigen/teichoic acid export membrane protein
MALQAFWVGIGSFGSFLVGLISAALFSRYFDKAEYGTYRQILFVYNTLLVIFSAGLPRVYAYYLPKVDIEQSRDVVNKITRILLLMGLIFSAFLFFSSGIIASVLKNPELEKGLKLFSPIPLMLLPTLGIEGIFSTYKKAHIIAIYNILSRSILLICIILPVMLIERSYVYAIYGWFLAGLVTLIIAFYFKNLPFRGVQSKTSDISYRTIIAYSLPIGIASLWGIASKAADQFYISRFFGAEVFAVFSNGFIQLPLVEMITGATSVVLMPEFSRMTHNQINTNNIVVLWRNAIIKSALIIYPLVVFFIFYAKSIMVILYSNSYVNSTIYFQIAMVLNFFNIIIFTPLILALGKTRFYSNVHLYLALTAWVMDYVIILIFNSPISIAVFSILLAVSKTIFFVLYIARVLRVSFLSLIPAKTFAAIIVHSFIAMFIMKVLNNYFFQNFNHISNFLVNASGYVIILLSTGFILKMDYLSVIRTLLKKAA